MEDGRIICIIKIFFVMIDSDNAMDSLSGSHVFYIMNSVSEIPIFSTKILSVITTFSAH